MVLERNKLSWIENGTNTYKVVAIQISLSQLAKHFLLEAMLLYTVMTETFENSSTLQRGKILVTVLTGCEIVDINLAYLLGVLNLLELVSVYVILLAHA